MNLPKKSDRASCLVELCRGKTVLHVGCADEPFTERKLADGTLLHGLIGETAAECYGVDVSDSALEVLRRRGFEQVMAGRIEELVRRGSLPDAKFDIVLAAEVLEHVCNAGSFLLSIRRLLKKPGAKLVITTPNAYCGFRFVYTMLTGRERVHPDHVTQYSPDTLRVLLGRCGFDVDWLRFYSGCEYLHNEGAERLLWWIDRVSFRLRPQLGSGMIICCQPRPECA